MRWRPFRKRDSVAGSRPVRYLSARGFPQDGDLKLRLSECYRRNPNVKAAFLARIDVSTTGTGAYSICVRTEIGRDLYVVRDTQRILTERASPDPCVDLVFIDAAQEAALRRSCAPFFSTAE
jgi:hypothetical protein